MSAGGASGFIVLVFPVGDDSAGVGDGLGK